LGYDTHKGFEFDQFKDAFARYLPSSLVTPISSVTRLQPNIGAGFEVTEGPLRHLAENPLVTVKPLSNKACNRVTEKNGEIGQEESFSTGEDAFNRYLSSCAEPPVLSETSKQPNGDGGFSVSDEVKHCFAENLDETRKPLLDKACFDVSDNKGKTHDKESFVSVNKEDEEEL